ncbi:tail fiber domain-containing protein [Chromobacterium subtsugae]|uniref:tail fiber domain-containing protein n=1 Tax=Chromobacterium subtsugae TaxID=251747 RepID=UPI0006410EBD|nr:tail fiber domain-containing protein [Chromobacterium subtsugae]OBU84582.1 hypothetical protein MY55_21385 [Chromobacterium subtsugae]
MRYDHFTMLPERAFRPAGFGTSKLATLEGGGKGGSAPAAPDPTATAAAQTTSNQQTAAYNAALNRTNTYTPLGNSTWTQNGTDPTTGAPIWSQSINLSPGQQHLYDSNMQGSQMMQNTSNQLLGNVGSQLSSPVSTNGMPAVQSSVSTSGMPGYAGPVNGGDLTGLAQNATNASYNSQMSLLQPQMDQANKSLAAQLANQGITPGSEAYNNAMDNQARQQGFTQSQAANNATLQGMQYQNQLFNQGLQNANLQNTAQAGLFGIGMQNAQLNNSANQQMLQNQLTMRNQPLNELNALRTGSQVQMPNFSGAPGVSMNPTNTMAATQMAYQGQLNAYNAQAGQSAGMMNGLFSLGGMLGSAYMLSDRRLKKAVQRIGTGVRGLALYAFRYLWQSDRAPRTVGYMAQDVRRVAPGAVFDAGGGNLAVNMGAI